MKVYAHFVNNGIFTYSKVIVINILADDGRRRWRSFAVSGLKFQCPSAADAVFSVAVVVNGGWVIIAPFAFLLTPLS